jgi:aspartate kinase
LLLAEGITVDTISQVLDEQSNCKNILISIKYADIDQVSKISDSLKDLCKARSVKSETNISRISLIGVGLANEPQITGDLVANLEDAGIAVTHLSTSEMRISCFVPEHQAAKASQLLHRKFIGSETIQFPLQRKEETRKQLSRIG